jgi:hypothetical protein
MEEAASPEGGNAFDKGNQESRVLPRTPKSGRSTPPKSGILGPANTIARFLVSLAGGSFLCSNMHTDICQSREISANLGGSAGAFLFLLLKLPRARQQIRNCYLRRLLELLSW